MESQDETIINNHKKSNKKKKTAFSSCSNHLGFHKNLKFKLYIKGQTKSFFRFFSKNL